MTDARALLHELAVPRLAGTPGHAGARARLGRELRGRGLEVSEWPFPASAWRLTLVAAGGVALCAATVPPAALLLLLGAPDLGALARAVALAGLVLWPVLAAFGVAAGRRVEGVTLVGTRPGAAPAVWLTAHYDSKGQPISMLWRLVGAGAAAVQLILLVALAAGALPGPGVPAHALLFLPGVAGGALLATNVATARSPGALDNVSGVLAVLAVLDRLPPHAPVGVILPDAEELGLVGARAFARGAPERLRDTAVINFDGIGDRGATRALLHRPGPLVADVARAVGARPRRWLPVLVDGLAFAPAARECITLLKGDWRTARIVHTPRDTADRLTLDGVADVAERVAGVLAALTARE